MLALLLQGLVEYGGVQSTGGGGAAGSSLPPAVTEIWSYVTDEPAIVLLGLVTVVMLWGFFRTRPGRL